MWKRCVDLKRFLAALAVLASMGTMAHARPVHIVAFGDSLTSGYLVPRAKAYPAQLQAALRKKGYDVTVKNAGLGGDTARHALKRFDYAIDPGTDICIVEFGINDRRGGASMKQVRARIAEILRSLRARRIQVLLVGAGGLHFADLAKANDALYVEWKLPRHKYRARDGAHFSAEGYAILVKHMLPQIETLVRRAERQ
jgi:acyl-CoA thioesterase-1